MNNITMSKKYKTRDGRTVRILAVDLKNYSYPVAAVILSGDGEENVQSYTNIGLYYKDDDECEMDLIEVEPFKKDDRVMVKRSYNSKWVRRHFSHMVGDTFRCFDDGKNSWASAGESTTTWTECRAYDPKVDGE